MEQVKKKIFITHPIEQKWIREFHPLICNSRLSSEFEVSVPTKIQLHRQPIRLAKIVVADVSHSCSQVALEVGYDLALGVRVIGVYNTEHPCSKVFADYFSDEIKYKNYHDLIAKLFDMLMREK